MVSCATGSKIQQAIAYRGEHQEPRLAPSKVSKNIVKRLKNTNFLSYNGKIIFSHKNHGDNPFFLSYLRMPCF